MFMVFIRISPRTNFSEWAKYTCLLNNLKGVKCNKPVRFTLKTNNKMQLKKTTRDLRSGLCIYMGPSNHTAKHLCFPVL